MLIHIADPTGLCFGVKRAIQTLEKALKENSVVYSLGSPIHNSQEVQRLKKLGLVVVESVDDVPENSVSFVRAHGIAPEIYEKLKAKSHVIVDGTCPFVKNAQEKAKALSQEGYLVVILGDAMHPEVKGIVGYTEGTAFVLSENSEIPLSLYGKKIGILSQTTQKISSFSNLVGKFAAVSKEMKVFNTICKATLERQESVCELASKVDRMLVIGGKDSANTHKLVEISSSAGIPTEWIERADELDGRWLEKVTDIGIAAGGSTPDWLIEELKQKLKEM